MSWEAGLKNAGKSPFGAGSGNYEKTSLQYQWSMSSLYGNPRKAKESTPSAQNRQGFNEVSGEEITTDEGEEVIVTPSAHNTYIRVLLENGLIGLSLLVLAWGWLAVAGAKVVWRINELPEWLKIYVLISFISFLAFLPMGTFIDTLHWRFLWVMAGILGGVIFIAGRYLIEEKSGGQ